MILVTGAAGFIGSNFVIDWLDETNESVLSVDKLTYAGNLMNFSGLIAQQKHNFVKGDICNEDLMQELFREYRPRAVVNFAAESHVDRSILGPEDFIQTNIVGTYRLLEVTRSYWDDLSEKDKKAFRFLHVSTDEVYGSLQSGDSPFSEIHRYKPNSPYSASKAASDHLVRAWNKTYGLPTLTTNCSNNYGPFQFPEKLIPLIIVNALEGKRLPVYGDGMQVRDWLYVKDHCSAIRTVLDKGKVGEVYNVGGLNEKTNVEVVKGICLLLDEFRPKLNGQSYLDQIAHVADRPGHDRRYAIDASKILKELNWKPLQTFESGLRMTVQWYLNSPDWIQSVRDGSYQEWIRVQYGTEQT